MKENIEKGLIDEEEENENDRECKILFLQNCALKSIDSLRVIKEELKINEHKLELMNQHGGKIPPPPEPEPREPLKPFVIEDPRQKIVERALLPGWNLPTVSIEEANYMDYQEMLEREARQKEAEHKKSQKLVKEFGDDDDEAEELKKTRDFDDFKDQNPRGSGNTGTKGYKYS